MSTQSPNQLRDNAINLLYEHLIALPDPDYGTINMLPFAYDNEHVRTLRRKVATAIVDLLDNHGMLGVPTQPDGADTAAPTTYVIRCNKTACTSEHLVSLPAVDGVSAVDAAMFISTVSQLNPRCPHNRLGLDDMRAHIQENFWSDTCRACGAHTDQLDAAGRCDSCTPPDEPRLYVP